MDLYAFIEKTAAGLGYELVDLEMTPRGRIIRVFIDKPDKQGGVDIDDCVRLSNQLTHALTVENVDYDRLEVSSPGLDRPLKKPADFVRFAGSEVHIKLRLPVDGRRNFNGVLLALQDEKLRLALPTGEIELDLGSVERARLVPRFD